MQGTDKIREHMEVVGSDGMHVGTVDHFDAGRLKLTKSDPAAGGQHHYVPLEQIDDVMDGKLRLKISSRTAFATWQA